VALEPRVAGTGLESARWAYEGAGRGPTADSRVGKFRIVVKRRGSPSGHLVQEGRRAGSNLPGSSGLGEAAFSRYPGGAAQV
jgi:hypothetical protein